MNYELAQKLKEAGWPQHIDTDPHGRTYYFIREDNLSFVHNGGLDYPPCTDNAHDEGDIMLVPSLSELIEACGDRFISLEKIDGGWQAIQYVLYPEGFIKEKGNFPEEAVANLWLALKENKGGIDN